MVKIIVFALVSSVAVPSIAQGVEELDRRNGFKDIKMTSAISSYEGLEFKKEVSHDIFIGAKMYVPKKEHYERIGNLKIHDLQVMTYKDSIYEIRVVTEKDPNLYKGFKKAFGEPSYSYGSKNYYWTTDNLTLSYGSHSKSKIEMIYFSHLMVKRVKEEKKQVVEDIVNDF
ncbi:hypothetical protein FNH22_14080 [Fulvivirga sp. M361]|uniref:hypothetical protein n=1 Tax=Fulvivirga sp. M361 TaxID=2594266 RepID=UPI001179C8C6|nr:hypothetical protein [Fulvivirga sp. M361]TRX58467.1 hypothetical protein FNH22_14080 [Fulvivirga sp. M361]